MNLAEFLANDPDTRKIFGKKEIEIVKKQLHGINLSQSEKNRLSQDIRPKLEFMKRANKFQDEFTVKKNAENKRIMKNAVKIILEDELGEDVEAVLLFGSQADGTQTFRSDIDICVVFQRDMEKKEATLFRKRIMGQTPEKADIQVFSTLPPGVKKEIAAKHKILYSKSSFDNIGFINNTILKALDTERIAET